MFLLLWIIVTPVLCRERKWEELVSTKEKISHIIIYSEIQGSILFHTSNTSKLRIRSNVYNNGSYNADDVKRLLTPTCDVNQQIKNGTINIRILPRLQQYSRKDFQFNGGFALMYSYCLTISILVSMHGWRAAITYGLLVSSVCVFAGACLSNITQVDVVVEINENQALSTIFVYQRNGTIAISNQMIKTSTNVSCGNAASSTEIGCPSCCYGNGICGIGNQCHCFKGFDEKTHCKMKTSPRHTVYTNPVDQRIIHLYLNGGKNTTLFGRKTAGGSVKNIKSFRSVDMDGLSSNIFMSKSRKISRVVMASGTTMSFDWKSKCSVHVTVIFNRSQGQLDKEIQLCKLKKTIKQNHDFSTVKENALSSFGGEHRQTSSRTRSKFSGQDYRSYIRIPVEIQSCNEPDSSAEVSATVVGEHKDHDIINNYLGSLLSYPGKYTIRLPCQSVNGQRDMETNVCTSFTQSADHLCRYAMSNYYKFQNYICKKVKAAMKVLSGVSRNNVLDVMNTCESSFRTVLSFCKEFYTYIKNNCNSDNVKFSDSFVQGNVSVKITATFPGNFTVYSVPFPIQIKENESFTTPVQRINDIRPKPRFIGFNVNPQDPRPFQRYNVTINYTCASSTTKVDMRIMGSDNYHNNITCHGVRDCNCCVLHVAGGAALVMDKVIVTLNDPLTQTITTREIAVLF